MLKKVCTLADFKLHEEGAGSFSGYGSVFDNRDLAGEVVVKGAFRNSLDRFKEAGFIAIGHDWQGLPVATVKDAREDSHGLFIECDFHTTEEAQKARTYVRERLERGKSVGLSIGYSVKDSERAKDGLLLKELDLFEVSIVTVPCNPEAQAVSAKSQEPETKSQYLGEYAEAEMTLAGLYDLCDSLRWRLFWPLLFDGEMDSSTRESTMDAGLAEFHSLAMRCVRAYSAADDAYKAELLTELKSLFPEPPPALAAGRLVTQLDTALAATRAATERYARYAATKEAEGRFPSPDRRDQLEAIHAEIGDLLAKSQPHGADAPMASEPPIDLPLLQMKASARRRRLLALGVGAPQ